MGAAILILLVIPFTNTSFVRNTTFRPVFKIFFWLFIADYLILTWIGQMPVRNAYIFIGQVATVYYFAFFTVIIPVIGKLETILATWKIEN
jgi:ubiquinol-cytochrome c reductase cytochrome b subunit